MFRRARLSVKPNVRPGAGGRGPAAPEPPRGPHAPREPEPAAPPPPPPPPPAPAAAAPPPRAGGAGAPEDLEAERGSNKTPAGDDAGESSKSLPTTSQRRNRISTSPNLTKASVPVPSTPQSSGTVQQEAPQPSPHPGKEKQPCSDRYRILKAQKLREMLREEMTKRRKQWKNKYAGNESQMPPDRSKMTMRDLIYYLPDSNPMKSSLEQEAKTEKATAPVQAKDQEEKNFPDAEDDVEEMEEESNDGPLLVPRVKVAEDGSIILDEESLTVEVLRTKGPCVVEENDPIFERGSTTTYSSFRKNYYSKPWSNKETDMFFLAISMVGTDFSMIGQLFPHRARIEIKNKFKREEKANGWRIDKAFQEKRPFDFNFFARLLEKVLAEEEKRKQKTVKNPNTKEKKSSRPRKKQNVNRVASGEVDDGPDESLNARISDMEGAERDVEIVEKENDQSLNIAEQTILESAANRKKRKRKKKDDTDEQEAENLSKEATDHSDTSKGEKPNKKKCQLLVAVINGDECNKDLEVSSLENQDEIACIPLSKNNENETEHISSASYPDDNVTSVAAVESLEPDTLDMLPSKVKSKELTQIVQVDRNVGGKSSDTNIKLLEADKGDTSTPQVRGRPLRPKPNLVRPFGKKGEPINNKIEAESRDSFSELPGSIEKNLMEKDETDLADVTGKVIEKESKAPEAESHEKHDLQETVKADAFKLPRLMRGRMQKPKPPLGRTADQKEVAAEDSSRTQEEMDKNESFSGTKGAPVQPEDQSFSKLDVETGRHEKEDIIAQRSEADEPEAVKENQSLQDGDKSSTLKRGPGMRTRFQKPRPNIGRATGRREIGTGEKAPKDISIAGKIEAGLLQTDGESIPLPLPDILSCGAPPSVETFEKEAPSPKEISSPNILLKPPCSPLEGCEEDKETQSIAGLEQVSDVIKSKCQQDEKPSVVKKPPFVRSRFKRPRPNLGRAVGKSGVLGGEKCELLEKMKTEKSEILIQENSKQDAIFLPQDHASLLQDNASSIQVVSSPRKGDSSFPQVIASSSQVHASSPQDGTSPQLTSCSASLPHHSASLPQVNALSLLNNISPLQDNASSLQNPASLLQCSAFPLQGFSSPLQVPDSSLQGSTSPVQDDALNLQNSASLVQDNALALQEGSASPVQNDALALQESSVSSVQEDASALQGSASPVQVDASALQGSASPVQEDASALQGSASPVQEDVSALQGSASPVQEDASALQGSASPVQEDASALQGSASPVQEDASALQGSASPVQEDASALQGSVSPVQEDALALQGSASPVQEDALALQGSASLVQDNASALHGTASLRGAASPFQGTPSLVQDDASLLQEDDLLHQGATSPLQADTFFPQDNVSHVHVSGFPAHTDASPPQMVASPLQVVASPHQDDAFLPQVAASCAQDGVSSLQAIASPHQVTVLSPQVSVSPSQVTTFPPENEGSPDQVTASCPQPDALPVQDINRLCQNDTAECSQKAAVTYEKPGPEKGDADLLLNEQTPKKLLDSVSCEPEERSPYIGAQENDFIVSIGNKNPQQEIKKNDMRPVQQTRGRFKRPRPNISKAERRGSRTAEKYATEERAKEEGITQHKNESENELLTLPNSKIESEVESSEIYSMCTSKNRGILEQNLQVIKTDVPNEQTSKDKYKSQTISPAQLRRSRFQTVKPNLGTVHRKKEEPGTEEIETNKNDSRKVEDKLLQQGDSDTYQSLKDKTELLSSLGIGARKESVDSRDSALSREYGQSEKPDSSDGRWECAALQGPGAPSSSVGAEERFLNKSARYTQQSKGPGCLKNTLGRRIVTSSISECEMDGSDRRIHRKSKQNFTKGRGSKRVRSRSSKKEPRTSKSVLVTLRASQEEDEEDLDLESEYEEENYHLAPEEVNKAPVFVPIGLRSPEPVSAQIEETMEELEISVNVPDVPCITVAEHLLPKENVSDERLNQKENLNAPVEITTIEYPKEETGINDGSTEAAIALLAMGNQMLQSESGTEGIVCMLPEDNLRNHTSTSDLDAFDHTVLLEHQVLSSSAPSTLLTSLDENKTVIEEQNTGKEVDMPGQIKENSMPSSDQSSKKTNSLRTRCRFPKPKPNLSKILGKDRHVRQKVTSFPATVDQQIAIQTETLGSVSKGRILEDIKLESKIMTDSSMQTSILTDLHGFEDPQDGKETKPTEREENQDEESQEFQVVSAPPLASPRPHDTSLDPSRTPFLPPPVEELPSCDDKNKHNLLMTHFSQQCTLNSATKNEQQNVILPDDTAVNLVAGEHQDEEEQTFILTLVEIPTDSAEQFAGTSDSLTSGPLLPAPILVKPVHKEEKGDLSLNFPVGEDSTYLSSYESCEQPPPENPPIDLDLTVTKILDCSLEESKNVAAPTQFGVSTLGVDCQEITSEVSSEDSVNVCKNSVGEPYEKQTDVPVLESTCTITEPQKTQEELSEPTDEGSQTASCGEVKCAQKEENVLSLPVEEIVVPDKYERTGAAHHLEQRSKSSSLLSRPGRRPLGFLSLICSKNNLESEEATTVNSQKRLKPLIPVSRRNFRKPELLNESKRKKQNSCSLPPPPTAESHSEASTDSSSAPQVSCDQSFKEESGKSDQNMETEEEPTKVAEFFFSDIFMEVDETE